MSDPQDWRRELASRLAGIDADPGRLHQIAEELSQHLDDRYAELVDAAVPPEQARRLVLDELAGPDVLRRAIGRLERLPAPAPVPGAPADDGWLTGLWSDVRDGLRALRASPLLTAVALATLSVGIGANAAIFSVVNAAILRPAPFAEPDRLVTFWGSAPKMGIPVVSYPDALYVYLRTRAQTMTAISAYSPLTTTLTDRSAEPERLTGATVTADFFRVLGRTAAAGRTFLAEEEAAGRNQVAIISHALWQRRFGGDPGMVGRTVTLDGQPVRVIGIMPPGFDFPGRSQVWLPIATDPQSLQCWCYSTVGRLTGAHTPQDAAREVAWLTDTFWREREGKAGHDPKSTDPESIVLAEPLARSLVGDVRRPLIVLLAAVGIVLAIACANIATLLLGRASGRRRELAVRCCLGASPWRIVRQLLIESLLLAVAGASMGLMLAAWGARVLSGYVIERLPHVQQVTLDPAVLLFTVTIALLTVVLFGVAPALSGARVDLQEAVKDGGRTTRSLASRRLADTFVVGQFALSIVLLVGSGLLLRSLGNVLAVDPGFRGENVLVGRISLPWLQGPQDRNATRARQFFAQLAERVSALPGVRTAGVASIAPFSDGNNGQLFAIRGREPGKGEPKLVTQVRIVSPGYFTAVSVPLLRGRFFNETDRDGASLVTVVDETLAKRYWPNGDAIGHHLRLGDDGPWRTIVGVAATVRHQDLTTAPERHVYVPHAQMPYGQMDLVVRAAGDAAALTPAIRGVIRDLDPTLPFYDVHTLDDAIQRSVETRRLTNNLLLTFALAALILAAIGIYGVMAIGVARRVHEFGIRLALGASRTDVLLLVVRQGMRLAAAGAVAGTAAALALTRYLDVLLFNVQPTEPRIFAAAIVVLMGVALAACLVPALRATATPPLEAIRAR